MPVTVELQFGTTVNVPEVNAIELGFGVDIVEIFDTDAFTWSDNVADLAKPQFYITDADHWQFADMVAQQVAELSDSETFTLEELAAVAAEVEASDDFQLEEVVSELNVFAEDEFELLEKHEVKLGEEHEGTVRGETAKQSELAAIDVAGIKEITVDDTPAERTD